MNVLYFLARFPKLSETFILNEIYELENNGHNVAVFALGNPSPNENIGHPEYEELDIQVRYAETLGYGNLIDLVSSKVIHPDVLKHATFRASPEMHGAALHRSKQCINFVDELNFDIDLIHAHFARLKTFPARLVSAYYNVPFTVTTHAYDLYANPDRNQLPHILASADHVITISEYNKRYIQTELTDQTPISVVRAGIRPEKFTPTSRDTDARVLTVARFVEKKGLSYAIEAISRIAEKFPDLKYHMIGSGPMADTIDEQIKDHGLTDTVRLLENVDDDRLLTEYDLASCFLLPAMVSESGDRDGIPVVLMESMAMETPPVSTKVSGIPELIDDDENGVLVAPRDADALADAVSALLRNPTKQRELGRAGRQKVKQEFNIATEVSKLESIFAQLIN